MYAKKIIFFLVILLLFSQIMPSLERQYLTTGEWYPADKESLGRMLDDLFRAAQPQKLPGRVVAIISPHAGLAFSGGTAAKAFINLQGLTSLRRIILLGVAHRSSFNGACVADHDAYRTPLGSVAVDTAIVHELASAPLFRSDRNIMQYEHSLENQLPFIQRMMASRPYKIVPVLIGALNGEDIGQIVGTLHRFIDGRTIVVASSDFTHYGQNFQYVPFRDNIPANLRQLDMGAIDFIVRLDLAGFLRYHEKTGITICGYLPIGLVLGLYGDGKYRGLLCDYSRSGDSNGDYSLSVSYAALVLYQAEQAAAAPSKTVKTAEKSADPGGLNAAEQKILLRLARATVQSYVSSGKTPDIDSSHYPLTAALKEKAGVFVTLREKGELRGCIGSIVGEKPLYLGVVENSVHAAVDDPRFPALSAAEVPRLNIEISVMSPLQPLADYHKIRLGIDGVIIRDGYAQAVFLPQVATETKWSLEQFLGHLCQKAGLAAETFRTSPTMQFYVFQAQVFAEKE